MDVPGIRHCIMVLTRMHHRRRWFLHASGHSKMGNIQRSQHQQNETEAKRPVQKARRGSIADHQAETGPWGPAGQVTISRSRGAREIHPTNKSCGLVALPASRSISATILIAGCGTSLVTDALSALQPFLRTSCGQASGAARLHRTGRPLWNPPAVRQRRKSLRGNRLAVRRFRDAALA